MSRRSKARRQAEGACGRGPRQDRGGGSVLETVNSRGREPAVAERGLRCWRRNQPRPSGRGYCWFITTRADDKKYVSRAGVKLEHALREFGVDVAGLVCADFGCNVGGFTDCLLQHGAAKVYAIDTGYGVLDYRLRTDDRVVVMERTNVLHAKPQADKADLVVIDLGWTRQHHAMPAALKWLKGGGRIITLIKPHYELEADEKKSWLVDGTLAEERAEEVLKRVLAQLPQLGVEVLASTTSPIRGAKSGRKKRGQGNVEYLVWARRITTP